MFFPPRDMKAEQELVAGSELRVIDDVAGHMGVPGITRAPSTRSTSTSPSCSRTAVPAGR
ncbi:hypothetical protein [Pseudonocardia sp. N23]|uniref:hypothetical protein n=1 Tax=Pseudonocardia sp. N23 TaxID=1987376 RepID=UPI000BFCB468|nr:hypothetical protein [Pseudonocardia sp. N23]